MLDVPLQRIVEERILHDDDNQSLRDAVYNEVSGLVDKGYEFEDAVKIVANIVSEVRNNYGD